MNQRQHRQNPFAWLATLLAVALLTVDLHAQTAPWFGGGFYDGHDTSAMKQALGLPYANNANGATNVLPNSAMLNGMLVYSNAAATTVSVYWGLSDCGTNQTAWAHTNDFGYQDEWALLTTPATGLTTRTTYYYRFYATNTAGEESWAATAASFLTPEVPVVTNGGASGVDAFWGTLNGSLVKGIEATIKVYWGPDSSAWGASSNLGVCAEGAFAIAVTGLTDSTTYYCQCFASNAWGVSWSAIEPFTTRAPEPPVVTNIGATSVRFNTASLNGIFVTGTVATITFYWGTDPSAWECSTNLGVRTEGPFSTAITGLSDSTLYYYGCFASNAAGTNWSAITPFTTFSEIASFRGGNYDGYDAISAELQMQSNNGYLIMIR